MKLGQPKIARVQGLVGIIAASLATAASPASFVAPAANGGLWPEGGLLLATVIGNLTVAASIAAVLALAGAMGTAAFAGDAKLLINKVTIAAMAVLVIKGGWELLDMLGVTTTLTF